MQEICFGMFFVVLILWPVAAGVSYMKDRQRLAQKMRRRAEAEGRVDPDPTRTAWHDYRRKYRQVARERESAAQAQNSTDNTSD